MIVECQACGTTTDHDANWGCLPPGWRRRQIETLSLRLCESCGDGRNFLGGLSPHLKELLLKRGFSLDDLDCARG